ncbi:His-Xaa-Ser system protein HxsD [Pseudomonas syringae]|nr:His-Xaa-Ser system protein HxsD [Pseudomonas syringae]EGH72841.1 hypothetical protein PSYAR_20006 [Pseudomonas syringae pv. aceris str. M302273]
MSWDLSITLDSGIYSLSVVQRVVYALASLLNISVQRSEAVIILYIVPTSLAGEGPTLGFDAARELVQRNLTDFALREEIHRETSGLREIIASAALRGAGI